MSMPDMRDEFIGLQMAGRSSIVRLYFFKVHFESSAAKRRHISKSCKDVKYTKFIRSVQQGFFYLREKEYKSVCKSLHGPPIFLSYNHLADKVPPFTL